MLKQLYELKMRKRVLDNLYEKQKSSVKHYMKINNLKKFSQEDYVASMSNYTTCRINKQYCPKDIWDKYAKVSSSEMFLIKKK